MQGLIRALTNKTLRIDNERMWTLIVGGYLLRQLSLKIAYSGRGPGSVVTEGCPFSHIHSEEHC